MAVGVVLLGTVAGCAQQQTGSAEAVGGPDGSAEPSAATSAPSASPTESGEGDDGRTVIRDLPLPISIEVPDGWREIDPERAGLPNVALLLQYEPMKADDDEHIPNVNVLGHLADAETSLEDVADAR
ncbi:hypothetical protein BJF85_14280 [Saccharomonospora sp. CUA-673]|uniref:hypothetical protein n=1 Tax=Saccharomonospora sp. CUA-673 TaxID=1904969 RepID=UPI00095F2028|nr:hypothetical protein [Saccharomonospora sp. CUA-673]OLT47808.1 hypothetical protein BJF85_14280 [Saccharomonospora sp. CUA-673]